MIKAVKCGCCGGKGYVVDLSSRREPVKTTCLICMGTGYENFLERNRDRHHKSLAPRTDDWT